jgi:hypothetical protein
VTQALRDKEASWQEVLRGSSQAAAALQAQLAQAKAAQAELQAQLTQLDASQGGGAQGAVDRLTAENDALKEGRKQAEVRAAVAGAARLEDRLLQGCPCLTLMPQPACRRLLRPTQAQFEVQLMQLRQERQALQERCKAAEVRVEGQRGQLQLRPDRTQQGCLQLTCSLCHTTTRQARRS